MVPTDKPHTQLHTYRQQPSTDTESQKHRQGQAIKKDRQHSIRQTHTYILSWETKYTHTNTNEQTYTYRMTQTDKSQAHTHTDTHK